MLLTRAQKGARGQMDDHRVTYLIKSQAGLYGDNEETDPN